MLKVFHLFQSVIFFMLMIIFFVAGPQFERTFFPVITKFEIPPEAIIRMDDGGTQLSGILIKVRGTCEPVEGSLTVFADQFVIDERYPSKKVQISLEDSNRWYTRPQGSQYFGPWTLTPPGPPLGPSLIIRIQHRCHPFWKTETVLYRGLTADFFSEAQIGGPPPPWKDGETNDSY